MRILTVLIFLSVFALISCSNPAQQPTPAVQAAAPVVKPAPQPMTGVELYTAYCASCHGVDGKGNGPAAPALNSKLPDLTQMAKKKGGNFPEGDTFQVIKWGGGIVGHGSKEMPVWGTAFRTMDHNEVEVNQRIKDLIQYLESVQQK